MSNQQKNIDSSPIPKELENKVGLTRITHSKGSLLDQYRENYNRQKDIDLNKKVIDLALCATTGLAIGSVVGGVFFKNWRAFAIFTSGGFIGQYLGNNLGFSLSQRCEQWKKDNGEIH